MSSKSKHVKKLEAFEFGHIHSGSVVYAQPLGHWLDMPVNETLILNNIIICYILKFTDKQTFVT